VTLEKTKEKAMTTAALKFIFDNIVNENVKEYK
jgi:hypothetical protein